jgi:hypothetical protein
MEWRDEIRGRYSTTIIPEHPMIAHDDAVGLWIDAGRMTADDALREVGRIAENHGLKVPDDVRPILDADGWCETPEEGELLTEWVDMVAEGYINDVIRAYRGEESGTVYAGWDADIGGFGLWRDPELEDDDDESAREGARAGGGYAEGGSAE